MKKKYLYLYKIFFFFYYILGEIPNLKRESMDGLPGDRGPLNFRGALQSNRGRHEDIPIGLTVTHHMDGTERIHAVY